MIHRIRVGVPDPLAYDLAWLVLFGLLPTATAGFLSRRGPNDNRSGGGRTAATLSLIAIVAAPIATRPRPGLNTAVVLFGPSTEPATLINAAVSADTPIIWMDPQWRLMVVSLPSANAMSGLYRAGAMIVTRSPAVAGCLAATAAS